jgi:hypothetical protein
MLNMKETSVEEHQMGVPLYITVRGLQSAAVLCCNGGLYQMSYIPLAVGPLITGAQLRRRT